MQKLLKNIVLTLVPAVRRLKDQRDSLLAQIDDIKKEKSGLLAQVDDIRKEKSGLLDQIDDIGKEEKGLWNLSSNFLDHYVLSAPSPQHVVDLFKPYWLNNLPIEGVTSGEAGQFTDPGVELFNKAAGGFEGKKVLDLGPMEGGLLYQLQKAGADKIVAVEANSFLYLKCLVAMNLLHIDRVELLLGEFNAYLDMPDCGQFDVIYASGVLYHQREPLQLLRRISDHTDCIVLITHYHDPKKKGHSAEYITKKIRQNLGDFWGTGYEIHYKEALTSPLYCGGVAPTTVWLKRSSIIGCLNYLGFDKIEIVYERVHPNGPAIGLVAKR